MLFIESRYFTKTLPEYLNDESYRGLQERLILNPALGSKPVSRSDQKRSKDQILKKIEVIRWQKEQKIFVQPAEGLSRRSQAIYGRRVNARVLNTSTKTVQSWEQGLRQPTQAAQRLLEVLEKKPEIIAAL